MVTGPNGEIIGDPLSDSEGILYADIDLAASVEPKQMHDIVGYYNRFDVFKLTVDRTANRPIAFEAASIERIAEPEKKAEAEAEPERDERPGSNLEVIGG